VASNIGTIGVARGGQEAIAHQTFWTYLVILCFEKSRPKQKMLLLVKNQTILPAPQIFCLPPKFWVGYATVWYVHVFVSISAKTFVHPFQSQTVFVNVLPFEIRARQKAS